jgi:phosphopantetheine adenylyltransferase
VVSTYIWRHAKQQGASVLFRGIRSWRADGPDETKLHIQNTWGPILLGPAVWPIPTIYLEGQPAYNHISSTLVRRECATPENLTELIPAGISDEVIRLYAKKKKKI